MISYFCVLESYIGKKQTISLLCKLTVRVFIFLAVEQEILTSKQNVLTYSFV